MADVAQIAQIAVEIVASGEPVAVLAQTVVEIVASNTYMVSPSGAEIAVEGAQPTVQLTYSTDFSEYTTGVQPSDWTYPWDDGTNNAYKVAEAGDYGGKVLQFYNTAGSDWECLFWNAIAAIADVEVLTRVKIGTAYDYVGGIGLRLAGSGATSTDYIGAVATIDASGTTSLRTWEKLSGSAGGTNYSTYAYSVSVGTSLWMRFRISGSTLYAKMWIGTSEDEPDWQITNTIIGVTDAGRVGVANYGGGNEQWDWFSVATNGGTAPFPVAGLTVTLPAAEVTVTATSPTVIAEANVTVNLSSAPVTLTTTTVTVNATDNKSVVLGSAEVTLTATSPTAVVSDHKTILLGSADVTLTAATVTAAVTANVSVSLGGASIEITGAVPTALSSANTLVNPANTTITVSGAIPTLLVSDHKLIQLGSGTITISGAVPTALVSDNKIAQLTGASIEITGATPEVESAASKIRFPQPTTLMLTCGSITTAITHNTWARPAGDAIIITATKPYVKAQLAFPGALGHGSNATGGRGGVIYRVNILADNTNAPVLNADGTYSCSLRAAVNATGTRNIIFEVGGVIQLTSKLTITKPNLSIFGQTAPYPGITCFYGGLDVQASNVLVQHLRFRIGDTDSGIGASNRDGAQVIGDGTENVIVDHCSFSWAVDEGVSVWYKVRNITYSNCLIAESLNNSIHPEGSHSTGILVGDHGKNVSLFQNLVAHCRDRNPRIKGETSSLVVNNAFYNMGGTGWCSIGGTFTSPAGPTFVTLLNNLFKNGVDTKIPNDMAKWEDFISGSQLYRSGNIYPSNIGTGSYIVATPPVWHPTVNAIAASAVQAMIVAKCGAWPAKRDATDTRIISSFVNGTGEIIDSQTEVGGFPTFTPTTRSLNVPANPNEDLNRDGYTTFEDWIAVYTTAVEIGNIRVSLGGTTLTVTASDPEIITTDPGFSTPGGAVITITGGVPLIITDDDKTVSPSGTTIVISGGVPTLTGVHEVEDTLIVLPGASITLETGVVVVNHSNVPLNLLTETGIIRNTASRNLARNIVTRAIVEDDRETSITHLPKLRTIVNV